jgi:hypothetical protein
MTVLEFRDGFPLVNEMNKYPMALDAMDRLFKNREVCQVHRIRHMVMSTTGMYCEYYGLDGTPL